MNHFTDELRDELYKVRFAAVLYNLGLNIDTGMLLNFNQEFWQLVKR